MLVFNGTVTHYNHIATSLGIGHKESCLLFTGVLCLGRVLNSA